MAGRNPDYETKIAPHIEKIREAVRAGATLKEIAEGLGIAVSTLCKYKAEKAELKEAFTRAREEVVFDVKAKLLKKALGYDYEEKKSVARKDRFGENVILVEKYSRHCPPSEVAARMILNNYDPTWRNDDKATVTLREQAQELKREIAEAQNMDFDFGEV